MLTGDNFCVSHQGFCFLMWVREAESKLTEAMSHRAHLVPFELLGLDVNSFPSTILILWIAPMSTHFKLT